MRTPPGVSPDEWVEWKSNPVTKAVSGVIRQEYDWIAGALGRGEILNATEPMITHGNAARVWGQLESLLALMEYMGNHK